MAMPTIYSNIIFQEVDYFENTATSLSLRRQILFSLRYIYKFQDWKMTTVMVVHSVDKVSQYISNPVINRRLVM
jgi:hypothetical protein